MNTQDITMKTPYQIELQQIFDEYHNPKWNDLEEIDKQHQRWNLNPPLKGHIKNNILWKKKDNWFIGIESAEIASTYTKLVTGYFQKFCENLSTNQYETYSDCLEKFLSMPPSLLGRHGCQWAGSEVFSWFELQYQIKFFICEPVYKGENAFFHPHGNAILEDYNEYENSHHFFEPLEGRLIPYGLVVMVHHHAHFHCLFTKPGDGTAFFQVGEDLPDLFYKSMRIDPNFWKSLSVNKIHLQNKREIKRLQQTN